MSSAKRWWILVTVSAGLLLISVDMTVLYTALPTLTEELSADASQKLWIINAYPLVMAGLLLGAGTLGDRVGHKRMFLIGLTLFGAASLLAAFAPTPGVLIGGRAFLAVGAAAMMPATLSLIRITFDDERERGIAIGVWGTMSVFGMAMGPIVGGLLLEHFWWGSVFLINVPVVLVSLVAAALLAPGGSGNPDKPWDLLASVQIMAGLVGTVYAIKELTKPAPQPLHVVLALLVAAAGFWLFIRRQRGMSHPLIDFALLRDPRIMAGVAAAGLAMFADAGIQLVLTQRLQLVLGLSPLSAGLLVAAVALGALPAGVIGGALLHRVGTRPLLVGGLLLTGTGALLTLGMTPGTVPFLALDPDHSAWIMPGLVVVGAGAGLAMTAASAAIIGNAPKHRAGMAASVEEVSYELGSLSGVAILGSLLGALYTSTIRLPEGAPDSAREGLDQAIAAAGELPDGQAADALLAAAHQAFDHGYTATLLIATVVLVGGAALTARLLSRPAPAPVVPTAPEDEPAVSDAGHLVTKGNPTE
ncbi:MULTISPECIES: MFS transporter [Streptomyces]|uniref:MFS transporter, DHA2 family, multidrug resistance protein n=2 Tax=Streptomyces TaxID=1883 RepID=A0A1I6U0A5_9ACTN|nr:MULTISPECIES: MFS transporter [Streptomyces]SFS94919.1 MFS transporter, DHA2 family, multidrug resistance protein [Streptomyces harbinensis]